MNTLVSHFFSVFVLLVFSVSSLYADDNKHEHEHGAEHKHEHSSDTHEQHSAHEHGVARLTLAVSDSAIEIMLESPAANILGFEHMASTDEDRQKLAAAKAKLEAGNELFSPNSAAECSFAKVSVSSALLEHNEETTHAHKHDADEHDHAHKKAHDDDKAETHNDIEANWTFDCAQTAKLKSINVKLFSAFPQGFERIQAEWVTDKGASAAELTQDDSLLLSQ